MEKTEIYQLTDIAAFADRLSRLGEHNPDYDLTKRELLEKGLVGQRVYEVLFPCEEVLLLPGRYDDADPGTQADTDISDAQDTGSVASEVSSFDQASPENQTASEGPSKKDDPEKVAATEAPSPEGAADAPLSDETTATESPLSDKAADSAPSAGEPDCLFVQVSGEKVGYIRKANFAHLMELLKNDSIVSLSLELHGGPYRMLFEDGILEDGDAGYYGLLTVEVKEPEPEKPADSAQSGTMHYISTSYDTVLLEERGRRGNGALVLALILGAFYLGFSIPYWTMVRRGMINASPLLGGDIANNLLNPHLAMVIGAVVLTLIAFLMKNSILPMVAGALFAASGWTLPGYTIFTVLSAILCVIAALRKPSKPLLTVVKILVFLGILGLCGWLLKDTALYFWNEKTFMIRPTGKESAPADEGEDSDEWDEYSDDWDDDSGEWDEFADGDDFDNADFGDL